MPETGFVPTMAMALAATVVMPKAELYGHATCRETGALAAAANVRRLWLTHYSAAVTDPAPGLAAARTAYPAAVAGYDGLTEELEFDREP